MTDKEGVLHRLERKGIMFSKGQGSRSTDMSSVENRFISFILTEKDNPGHELLGIEV